jgi:hypothetical protein
MYHVKTNSLSRAKELFLEAIQRTDASPHPLAVYMMGWLTELEGERRQAEQFYCYAAQLEPVDLLDYLRLVLIAEDTLGYVQELLKLASRAQHDDNHHATKKSTSKRRSKSNNNDIEVQHDIYEVRERLVMHERVVKLMHLRLAKMGKGATQLHPPKKFVNIDPLWLERLFQSFSICDDWSWLLKTSLEFRK